VRIVTVVGARPQFVKAAAVSRHLRAARGVTEILVHTGQHYDEGMSDRFFEELEIPPPDHHLGVGSGPHGRQTGRMLEALEQVLLATGPDRVLVYGDTNSTLAGALAAAKLHIPIDHVEAGLRSFNRVMPEEINRVLTDHLADLLFAPTETAVANLRREGLIEAQILRVGDVMYDAALHYGPRAAERSCILETLALPSKGYLLATVHRAENTDDPGRLRAIFEGLALGTPGLPVVIPLHPRTRAALVRERLMTHLPAGLQLIEPVGFLDMVMLEQHARLIATDSGGVQKEAFFYRVPCVTLRTETEWTELVALGWNKVVPPISAQDVAAGVRRGLAITGGEDGSPYGAGDAAARILEALLRTGSGGDR
jgi:UDP-GlcNAc3NAcA epimerase